MSAFTSGRASRLGFAVALLLASMLVGGTVSAQMVGRASQANIQAELVRRSGGEWVIVNIAPDQTTSAAAPSSTASQSAFAGLGDALRSYQRALEQQDIDLLARVWVMNPAERAQLQSFFDRRDPARVSLDWTIVQVSGDQAVVRFVQQLWGSSLPRGVPFMRTRGHRLSLSASDALGTWAR